MSLKILVVEDDFANQRVASLFLKKLGYESDIAENGHQAIEQSKKLVYGLILMDCQMPLMDGLEATRQIRSQTGPNQQTPIIALTANVASGVNQNCLDAGMNDILNKPVEIGKMKKVVSTWYCQ